MSHGRPLEYDPVEALDAAMQVFWSQGFDGTSLQDLLSATGLSKSSLYQGFGGKNELFERCINHYCDTLSAKMLDHLNNSESGIRFIEATLLRAAVEARSPDLQRGCLLMNTANEFSKSDPAIAKKVAVGFDRFRDVFHAAVRRGQREGDISASVDANVLASYLISNMGGLFTIVKGGADEKTVKEVVRVILGSLKK
jgi:TetR/AcrR family transcriptional repressor of nem operon